MQHLSIKINTPRLLTMIAATGTLLAGAAQAVLLHHWEFNEGSGAVAGDSVGSENGDIFGAVWDSDATRDSFLTFDGSDDYVNPTLELPLMTLTNDFTWATWVNSQSATQPNTIILGNRRDSVGGNPSPLEFIKITPTKFEWRPNNMPNNTEFADLPTDTWVHLAIVKDGDTVQSYYNGVLDSSTTLTNDFVNVMPFFIGGDNGGRPAEHFNGSIDDVRLYSHALNPAEVASLVPEPSTSILGALAFEFLFSRRKR